MDPKDLLFGFHNLDDRLGQLASDAQNVPLVNDAIRASLDAHNDTINAQLNRLSFRTTEHQLKYQDRPFGGQSQPIDEYGRARPIIVRGADYDLGIPLIGSGNALGETYLHQVRQTVGDVNNALVEITRQDIAWLGSQMLRAFFAKDNWTFEDKEFGDLTVRPLANGDAIRYPVRSSAGATTDNHLLAQSADISDAANPFKAIADELREHPANTGAVLVFVSSQLLADIETLAGFMDLPEAEITLSANTDRLTAAAPAVPFGIVRGYIRGARVWIVEWARLDEIGDGAYMIGMTTDGPRPLAMREYPEAQLQGFRMRGVREDYPYREQQFSRWAGFGAWNRTGALIYQIGAASYSVPTGFSYPNH